MNLYRPLPITESLRQTGGLSRGLGLLFVFLGFIPTLIALTTVLLLAMAPAAGVNSSLMLEEVGHAITASNRLLSDAMRFGVVLALGLVAQSVGRGLWVAVPMWLWVAVGQVMAGAGLLRWELSLAVELGERALACATLMVVGEAFRRRGQLRLATAAMVAVFLGMGGTVAQLGSNFHRDLGVLVAGLLMLAQLLLSSNVLFRAWKELPMPVEVDED